MDQSAARQIAASSVASVVSPLVAEYENQLNVVENSQKSLSTKLTAVLTELQTVQSSAPNPSNPTALLIGPYVKKVEALRKRLDNVSYTMNRVQVRLESLQDAVVRHEGTQRRQQQQAKAAAAVAASVEGTGAAPTTNT